MWNSEDLSSFFDGRVAGEGVVSDDIHNDGVYVFFIGCSHVLASLLVVFSFFRPSASSDTTARKNTPSQAF